jgi:hypothetical protein
MASPGAAVVSFSALHSGQMIFMAVNYSFFWRLSNFNRAFDRLLYAGPSGNQKPQSGNGE